VIKERLIDPLQPVGRYLDGYRIAEMRESQIRPWPIHGTLNEPCPDWITKDIPDSRKKMAVLLDGKTLEPTLPHMAVTPVMLVIPPDVTGHPPLHEGAQCRFGGGLHNHVKVIRHQAQAEHLDREFGLCCGEQIEEGCVVPILVENGRTPVPSIEEMVRMPSNLSSRNPWHDSLRYANHPCWRKDK
jgi:hypothetical protein